MMIKEQQIVVEIIKILSKIFIIYLRTIENIQERNFIELVLIECCLVSILKRALY